MFYVIAIMLVIVALFFLYSSISAFNELRKGIKKKVQAKPYMVGLFFFVALLLLGLAYISIVYQATWDQNWNEFWADTKPLMSEQSKSQIYEIVNKVQPITMYGAFGVAALFTISLMTFRKLSAHLFIGSITLAVITFLCFIASQYTEPSEIAKEHEEVEITEEAKVHSKISAESSQSSEANKSSEVPSNKDSFKHMDAMAINQYFQNEDTDVLTLSLFVREHFRIPRDLTQANIDQLRQYNRGLIEMKQGLARANIPRGAEEADSLTKEWLQEEINIVTDCLAEKRETGILGLMVKFNNLMADLIFDRNRKHHSTTDKLRTLRSEFVSISKSEENLNLKEHFSFIK